MGWNLARKIRQDQGWNLAKLRPFCPNAPFPESKAAVETPVLAEAVIQV